jgi:hypothetical protein
MGWVKVTRVAATGLCQFFTAPDQAAEPGTWTKLGTDVSTAAGNIWNGASTLAVGSHGSGTGENWIGTIARAIVRNGIGGTTVLDVDRDNATVATGSFTATTGGTVTVNQTGMTVCASDTTYAYPLIQGPVLDVDRDNATVGAATFVATLGGTITAVQTAGNTIVQGDPNYPFPLIQGPVLDVSENNAGTMGAGSTFTANTGQTVTVNQTAGNTVVQPQPDTTVWRFDANDYVSGTSYTDPRGRVWTLSAGGAIVPKTSTNETFGRAVMESNYIPVRLGEEYSDQWTVQLMAKGTGLCKVGLVWWDSSSTGVDWGTNESWLLSPDAWTHIASHRVSPQAYLVMLRIEAQGSLTIDKVLVERGFLKDWEYFDGSELYGGRDDFSWYGGTNRQGASYSLWYSSRRAVFGRLFARDVDVSTPGPSVTDEDIEAQGLVYRFVPAGIEVIPHMDVFHPYDPRSVVPMRTGLILPYYSTTVTDGVPSPW